MRTYRPWPTGAMIVDGLGALVWWLAKVPGRNCNVAGGSVGRNGVAETKTHKSLRRDAQQSVRFQMMMLPITAEAPKSTCHQALVSKLVAVTEPSKKFPSV